MKQSETPEPDQDALQAGQSAAFDVLHRRYAPRVLGYLLRRTDNCAEAEDLTQETFVAAFTGCRSFSGRSRPLAWLLGIAVRRLRDQKRKERVRPMLTTETESATPGDMAENVVRAQTLETALTRLDDPLRETFLLVASQQLTYREAADILNEPVGTVKWRMHEATKRLRCLLSENEESR